VDDNLVISEGFAGLPFANSFGSVPPDTILAVGPGWRATHLIAQEFPNAFIPTSVGTTMVIRA
jgi:hypothetical protein